MTASVGAPCSRFPSHPFPIRRNEGGSWVLHGPRKERQAGVRGKGVESVGEAAGCGHHGVNAQLSPGASPEAGVLGQEVPERVEEGR